MGPKSCGASFQKLGVVLGKGCPPNIPRRQCRDETDGMTPLSHRAEQEQLGCQLVGEMDAATTGKELPLHCTYPSAETTHFD